MLESLVAWVLNNYVGEYFSLNTDQLSIALLQGQVDLENVPLRNTALRKFDIPVQVKSGLIGKLNLQIPLAHIRSQPWILRIKDFLAVLGPCTSVYDVEIVEQYQQQRKETMLCELELQHRKQLLAQFGVEFKDNLEQNSWWGASLISAVSNNIQIVLENTHIKYECPEFAFGIRIQNLIVQTTNAQWRPGFVEATEGVNIFKKFDIKGFSVYWNTNQSSTGAAETSIESMKANSLSDDGSYILQPLAMQMRIEKNSCRFPLRSPNIPRFKVDIRSQKIELEVNKQQMAQMQKFSQDWILFERARPHRKWRPIVTVHESPKQWWRFAIGRVREEIRSRASHRSTREWMAHIRMANRYCREYRRRLEYYLELGQQQQKSDDNSSPPAPTLPHEGTALIKQIEHDDSQFGFNDLHNLREAVFQKLLYELKPAADGSGASSRQHNDSPFEVIQQSYAAKRDGTHQPAKELTQPQGQGWLHWMTNWFAGEDPTENQGEEELNEAIYLMRPPKLKRHKLAPELEKLEKRIEAEILQVLNESLDDSNILRRDNLLAEVLLKFSRVYLRIASEKATTMCSEEPSSSELKENNNTTQMLTFDLHKLCSRIQLSAKEHRTEVSLSVEDLSVQHMQLFPLPPCPTPKTTKTRSASTSGSGLTQNYSFASVLEAGGGSAAGENSNIITDEFELESLGCGFQSTEALKTRLLFTVGRTYDLDPMEARNTRKKRDSIEDKTTGDSSFLTLFYKRLAPKQEVYHELNISFAPISVILDENSASQFLDIFHIDQELQTLEENFLPSEEDNLLEHHLCISLTIPEVIFELRSQRGAQTQILSPHLNAMRSSLPQHRNGHSAEEITSSEFGANSAPFVRGNLQTLSATFTRWNCAQLSNMDLAFDSLLLEDLFENTVGAAADKPLLRIVMGGGKQTAEKDLSRSCPGLNLIVSESDLTANDVVPDDENITECGDLASDDMATALSSSLPIHSGGIRHRRRKSMESIAVNNRTGNKLMNGRYRNAAGAMGNHKVSVTFIPADHAEFSTKYDRNDCKIVGSFEQTEVEVSVNRRTWILLLDFIGLTSGTSSKSSPKHQQQSYTVNCELSSSSLVLGMNYPQNGTQLGVFTLRQPKLDLQVDLNIADNPLLIGLSANGLSLSDLTPFYGTLYTERLNIAAGDDLTEQHKRPSFQLNVLKYRVSSDENDAESAPPQPPRQFDLMLTVEVNAHVNYVHTQRYFTALLDFWTQFAELYDKITFDNSLLKSTTTNTTTRTTVINSLKTRCQINMELLAGANLYLPLNQHSAQAILFEVACVQANNTFCSASSLSKLLGKHLANYQQQHQPRSSSPDCLLDSMDIHLQNMAVRYGTFSSPEDSQYNFLNRQRNAKTFQPFNDGNGLTFFSLPAQIVLDAPGFSPELSIYRNLSSLISHNVPDMFVLLRLTGVALAFTSDFYKLIRGCMDHNLGEQLIPQPETIPLELLEMPEINLCPGEKYPTFSLRVALKKVQLHLSTPLSPIEHGVFEQFARLQLRSAKIVYDCYVDSASEFDFICESASLEDSRPDYTRRTSETFKKIMRIRSNAFSSSASRKESGGQQSDATISSHSDGRKLLFETHIQMRKDEPPIFSIIFIKTRIILLMDWIERFKAFLLLNSDFKPQKHNQKAQRCTTKFEVPKSGILLRAVSPFSTNCRTHSTINQQRSINSAASDYSQAQLESKYTLKVTLKDCELVALENPCRADSFALVAQTTGVILCNNLADPELLESQYEIQQFCLFWCLMSSEVESFSQLTNESSATVSIYYEQPQLDDKEQQSHGHGKQAAANKKVGMEHCLFSHRQIVDTQLGPLIVRGSLKDFFVAKTIFDAFFKAWERAYEQHFFWADESNSTATAAATTSSAALLFPTEALPPSASLPAQASKVAQKCLLNASNLCIWILRESTGPIRGTMVPFLRVNVNDFSLQKAFSATKMRFSVSMDYYRDRNPLGWEPLLEPLRLSTFDLTFTEPNLWNLWVKSDERNVAELNLTQTFIEQLLDFMTDNKPVFRLWESQSPSEEEAIDKVRAELSEPQSTTSSGGDQSSSVTKTKTAASSSAPHKAKLTSTQNVQQQSMMPSAEKRRMRLLDPKQLSNPGHNVDIQLELDAGIGISLIGSDESGHPEELVYARLSTVRATLQKRRDTYQFGCCINSIQMDNQLFGADRHHFFFCDPNALKDELVVGPFPALNFEMSCTSTEHFDAYESFRLKMCNSCIYLDEHLLWRLVNFGINIYDRRTKHQQRSGRQQQSTTGSSERNCYFGVFQLEFAEISLSVITIDKNGLPPRLRTLKESYSDKLVLVSFENAPVRLSPFWAHRCFTTLGNLFANVVDFYIEELKKQKLNIVVAMDAFGNPIGLANDFKEGIEGLLFEGDLAGFTFGLGYGAAKSISKVASSMAQGVGSLTFDDQHEQFRRRMLRSKPEEANAFTHLYGGLKGFGVGVFGGLTAIVKNTATATRQDGFTGVFRGVTTGAVDTLTKPLQGTLDLVEGTASAFKEVVGASLVRRAFFPKKRLRHPRVCTSLTGLLPAYSAELALGQQELMRITGSYALNDENRLLCIVPFYDRINVEGWHVVQRALITLTQCYIIRQVDEQPSMVTYRILLQHLKKVQLGNREQQPAAMSANSSNNNNSSPRPATIEVFYTNQQEEKHRDNKKHKSRPSTSQQQPSADSQQQKPSLTLWCSDREAAQRLCKQIMKAKAQFDRRGGGNIGKQQHRGNTSSSRSNQKKKMTTPTIFDI